MLHRGQIVQAHAEVRDLGFRAAFPRCGGLPVECLRFRITALVLVERGQVVPGSGQSRVFRTERFSRPHGGQILFFRFFVQRLSAQLAAVHEVLFPGFLLPGQ